MIFEELEALLENLREAIYDDNHKKMFEIISSVTEGVSDVTRSKDIFISQDIG